MSHDLPSTWDELRDPVRTQRSQLRSTPSLSLNLTRSSFSHAPWSIGSESVCFTDSSGSIAVEGFWEARPDHTDFSSREWDTPWPVCTLFLLFSSTFSPSATLLCHNSWSVGQSLSYIYIYRYQQEYLLYIHTYIHTYPLFLFFSRFSYRFDACFLYCYFYIPFHILQQTNNIQRTARLEPFPW